jgi:hypothetical protein
MIGAMSKEDFTKKLCDVIVDSYDVGSLKKIVWDSTYEELIQLGWEDLHMHAEDFGMHE